MFRWIRSMSHYYWYFLLVCQEALLLGVSLCGDFSSVHHACCCVIVSVCWWKRYVDVFDVYFSWWRLSRVILVHAVALILQSVVCDLVWSATPACVCCETCTHNICMMNMHVNICMHDYMYRVGQKFTFFQINFKWFSTQLMHVCPQSLKELLHLEDIISLLIQGLYLQWAAAYGSAI